MKNNLSIYMAMLLVMVLHSATIQAQALTGYNFQIVNMMPNAQSNDIFFDSETNVAVNPANTNVIAGSAFTKNPTGATSSAPIYISSDGGTTWSLNNILPSGNGMTGDVSVGFATSSGNLYAGILRGGSSYRCMMLRTNTPTTSATMTTLVDRSTVTVDQPFVVATTINDASAIPRDRIYSGDNLYGSRKSAGGNGRTAEVMVSNDAGSAPPSGISNRLINPRTAFAQDMPAIRTAVHSSGVVYAAYYRWTSGASSPFTCDVMIARDDNFASGGSPFNNLNDGGDGLAGQKVVTGRSVPAFGVSMGNNRLVASNIAVAVNPNNSANVFIGWCDRVSTNDYTLHFRRSTNSGQGWGSSDWLTVTNATNPGIAVANNGKVALIYQQFTGSGSSARWETHLRTAGASGSSFTDDILSSFLDTDLSASTISPSLGDYLEIQAVGNSFYGVFPASNRPVMSNFPHSVTFQRNADFASNQLRNVSNTANVAVSVDPFFFKISPSLILNICIVHPEICVLKFIDLDKYRVHIPAYPCLRCPWPCLQCPPFEIPFEEIYQQAIRDGHAKTMLSNPYFHLSLNGYNPVDFDIAVTSRSGESIKQEINKTDKGYVLTFRASKSNFSNIKGGIKGLIITVQPKNAQAANKGAEFDYRLNVSDYQLKEFMERDR